MRPSPRLLTAFWTLVDLVGSLNAEIECNWFGEGPYCTTDAARCPEEWALVAEASHNGIGENCTEGTKKYCCDADIFVHQEENEFEHNQSRTHGFFKAKQYVLMKLLSNHDKGGVILEARIICPQQKNDGSSLSTVRIQLEQRLIKQFGGLTRFDAAGGWVDGGKLYEEPVWVYDVAVENTAENREKLRKIANWLKTAAEQESVYLRYPGGQVTFV